MREKIKIRLRRSLVGTMVAAIFVLMAFVLFLAAEEKMNSTTRTLVLCVLSLLMIGITLVIIIMQYRTGKQIMQLIEELSNANRDADEKMREVVANITHDLKTPITAVKGYAQGILDGIASTPDRIQKYVTTIRNKAEDMSYLVDELSFFSQIYQNTLRYDFQMVNMNEFLSDCVSALSLDMETRRVDLIYRNLMSEDIQLYMDREKLKRVINNIIGNASKYIEADRGIILVSMEDTGEEVIVHIKDNGVGIQKDELPMIFERFYRTDSSRNSSTGGSGLGLAIAKKIIERHRGRIWAESERGKGTIVSFSLPKYRKKEDTFEKDTDY